MGGLHWAEWHRRALVRVASDMTDRVASRSALVFAPHPDDETIGCGATIIRKIRAGADVRIVIVTDGRNASGRGEMEPSQYAARRRDECFEACRRLGVPADRVQFLDFEDGSLSDDVGGLVARLREVAEGLPVDEVYGPCSIDLHSDHRALADGIDRLRADVLRDVDVFSYPVWFWNRWAWTDRTLSRARQAPQLFFRPLTSLVTLHPRIVRTAPYADDKRHALAAYVSQLVAPPDDPDREVLDPAWLETFLGREELFFETGRR